MQDNIYSTPASSLLADEMPIPEFYVVSKRKFYMLYFSTIGFYGIYWNFKNWKQYKLANNEDLWPVARTIFALFFTHALYAVIDMRATEREGGYKWHPNLCATFVIISLILDNILGRVESTNILACMFIYVNVFVRGLFVFQAQKAINVACGDIGGQSNSRFSIANIMWIIFGVIILILAVIGTLFPSL